MRFARVRYEDPLAAPLIADLRREYEERYGPSDAADDVAAPEFDPPDGLFVVLLDDDAPALAGNNGDPVVVAGGGIRRYDEVTCEIKRMWTSSAYRRQGHAITVLAELESIARELGYQRLLLETGPAQPEALALYRRLGYRETGPYGRYPHAYGFERWLVDQT
ncbi:GNAT family N-acetyltransferase [Glaciibacter sp. 2TAF33]|uniref:GNAT family N-acetyltransferase n=1 Tax=Glaciibacter sp. 2TAF33 TaxID=3233015 RepID=UPI003F8FB9EA